jgi:hypothetical protein
MLKYFLKPLLRFTRLDRQRNSDVRKRFKITNTVEVIQDPNSHLNGRKLDHRQV